MCRHSDRRGPQIALKNRWKADKVDLRHLVIFRNADQVYGILYCSADFIDCLIVPLICKGLLFSTAAKTTVGSHHAAYHEDAKGDARQKGVSCFFITVNKYIKIEIITFDAAHPTSIESSKQCI